MAPLVGCRASDGYPFSAGQIVCKTNFINKGRSIVTLESELFNGEQLVAKAMGTYAIFKARKG
jgi:acyl-CoA thioesterase